MPPREEVVGSLWGAYLLARADPSGMTRFNLTFEGFWRSFFAAVLVAPGYAILVADKLMTRPEAVDPLWATLVEGLAYVASWAAFPLAAVIATRLLDLGHLYVALIVATNWAAAIQIVLFVLALILSLVLPGLLAGLVLAVVTVAILLYQWFVIRTALMTTGGVAFGLVLLDLVLNTIINVIAEGML